MSRLSECFRWGVTIVDDDPYLWLEDITSEQALDRVRQNSETTLAELSLNPWDDLIDVA